MRFHYLCDGRSYEQVISKASYGSFSLIAQQTKEDNGFWVQTVACDYYMSGKALTRSSEFRTYVGSSGTYFQTNVGLVHVVEVIGLSM